eukprot:7760540-Ditylum_brightwellii.AAC.1
MALSKMITENSAAVADNRKKVYTKDNMPLASSTTPPLLVKRWSSNDTAYNGHGKACLTAAQQAHDILGGEEAEVVKINGHSFWTALGAWKKVSPSSPVTAEGSLTVLKWMECLQGVISYYLVLDTIAKSLNYYSGWKAEELLQRM